MRQLNNNKFDTKEGASASLSEIVSSQFAPSVSQKDENQMKITEQLAIDVMKKKISLDSFNKQERDQIFDLLFGKEFMKSKDKGAKKKYKVEGGK
jgi:hypothetical protein